VVRKEKKTMVASCKSRTHIEEHGTCCTVVKGLWEHDAGLVPVEVKSTGACRGEIEIQLHDRVPVDPAPFFVPVDIPSSLIKDPDLVDRLGLPRETNKILLKPQVSCIGEHHQLRLDRVATLWGPWCSRKVELQKEVTADGHESRVSGEEYGIFPVDDSNFVDLWILYEWWSITWRGGTRFHCTFEHMTAKYALASGKKFMNKRLWYAACYKFVRSLEFMRHTLDKSVDLCAICQKRTPFSICMDAQTLVCDKRLLHPSVLAEELPHGDEVDVEEKDHGICFPDCEADIQDEDGERDYRLDHDLKLSVNARCLQQHLHNADGFPLHWSVRKPLSQVQQTNLQKLGNWAKSFARKVRLPPLTEADMTTLYCPPSREAMRCPLLDQEVRREVTGVCCWGWQGAGNGLVAGVAI
jgi:hypothetical protein